MGGRPLLLWALLLAGPALAGEPKSTKTQVSSNGQQAIRFLELGDGRCRVEGVKETEVVWQLEGCLATAEDLFFISDDGQRFWVVLTLPQKAAREARGRGAGGQRPWYSTVVAKKYDRQGQLLASKRLSEVVPSRHQRERMRQLERRFKWLSGAVGEDGKGPRINDSNQVELEALGATQTTRLNF